MRFSKTAKKAFNGALLLGLVWGGFGPETLASEVVDMTGSKVALSDRPSRVVTLAPSLGELAADLLGDRIDQIVGVSEYTDYPPALKKRTSIGPYFRFSIERIVSLKPDVVFATMDGNSKDQVAHLRELKVPVVVVSTNSLKDVQESIRVMAAALGERKRGDQLVDQLRRGISHVRERSRSRPKIRVLLQLDDPLVAVGSGTFLNEMLETVGATNVLGDTKTHYPKPSYEEVIKRDPQVILVLALNTDQAVTHFKRAAARWLEFPSLSAVKNRKVLVFRNDAILRPSLRLLEGLSLLEKAVYGPN